MSHRRDFSLAGTILGHAPLRVAKRMLTTPDSHPNYGPSTRVVGGALVGAGIVPGGATVGVGETVVPGGGAPGPLSPPDPCVVAVVLDVGTTGGGDTGVGTPGLPFFGTVVVGTQSVHGGRGVTFFPQSHEM